MKKQVLLESVVVSIVSDVLLAVVGLIDVSTVLLVGLIIGIGVLLIAIMRRWKPGTCRPPDEPPEKEAVGESVIEYRFSIRRWKR